jgi:signal peptidase I
MCSRNAVANQYFCANIRAMSEYLPGTAPADVAAPTPATQTPRASQFDARLFLGALLSAVLPGAGHFLLSRWRRGLVLLAVFAILFLVYWWLRLPQTLYGAFLPPLAVIGLCVFATWDAAYANRQGATKPTQWWLAALLPAALFAGTVDNNWIMRASGFRVFSVPSHSMEPAIPEGSRVMVDGPYYLHATPRHGEIVICIVPNSPGLFFAKRVIAVAGETIEVRGDKVLINGTSIDEPYAKFVGPTPSELARVRPITLPPGTLFLMGDNRHLSFDSRMAEFGLVDVSAVRGKVIYSIPSLAGHEKKF